MSGIQQIFLGTAPSGLVVNLQNYNAGTYNIQLERINALASTAQVRINLLSTGIATYDYEDEFTPTTNFLSYTWLTSGSAADAYAFMDTPSSGGFAVGSSATNTSLVLTTNRSWSVNVSSGGGAFADALAISNIRIKNAGGTDLAAKSIYMYVSVGV